MEEEFLVAIGTHRAFLCSKASGKGSCAHQRAFSLHSVHWRLNDPHPQTEMRSRAGLTAQL